MEARLRAGHIEPQFSKPIPGGIQLFAPANLEVFHLFLPGPGAEPSSITDFDGLVAVANVAGTGKGTNPRTGTTNNLNFDVDIRFMKGLYVGVDGQEHRGTFAFI